MIIVPSEHEMKPGHKHNKKSEKLEGNQKLELNQVFYQTPITALGIA